MLHARLAAQLGHPRGRVGRLLVRVLDRENRGLNAAAVAALEVGPGDRTLDVGFGGGVGLALLLDTPAGAVSGAELSADAVAAARRRFAGRVELVEAAVPHLPFGDGAFDRVVTVNTVYFWPDGPAGVAELRRVLAPGGRLVVGVGRPETMRGRLYDGFRLYDAEALAALLHAGGFASARVVEPAAGGLLGVGS